MIRIILNIENFSPFLQTVSGEVVVEHIDFRKLDSTGQVTPVFNCLFNFKPNSRGYNNINGADNVLFEALKPQMDTMINSYMRGMILAPHDHSWVEDSKDITLNEWLHEKGVTIEIPNKH